MRLFWINVLLIAGLLCGAFASHRPPRICRLPLKTGICKAKIPRWGFVPKTSDCVEFIYGGCRGNQNNFESYDDCLAFCGGPLGICGLPIVVGPCRAAIPRWAFVAEEGDCVKFTYGGCSGNRNNFETYDECIESCGGFVDN